MSIDPRVKAVIAKIKKKHGDDTIVMGSDISLAKVPTITSGSLSLDVALGGGWAANHWIEVCGHESAGKTLIVLKTIAANQALDSNWTVIWFATEDFSESYAEMMGVDLDRVVVMNENEMEAVYESAKEFLDTRSIDCIVIDSLPGLVPAREMDGTMEDFQPGLVAFLTGKFFRKTNPSMKRSLVIEERACTGFIINQWREKIGGYGDPRTTPGGKGKNFFFYQRVDVKRDEWINNTKDDHIGQVIKVSNIKNKIARPGRVGMIDAYFAKGKGFEPGDFDLVKDSISAAIAYEVIERPDKLHYTFGGQTWNGRPKMEAALAEDAELAGLLRKEVLAVALAPPPAPPSEPSKRAHGKK